MKLFGVLLLLIAILFVVQHYLGKALIGQKKKYAIGIYEGENPLYIAPASDIENPILTKFDVTDVKASFVADPFIIKEQDSYYLFMEVKSKRARDIGEIAVAHGPGLDRLRYDRIVLREDFHLSFPHVFKWEGAFYMLPESGADRRLRLYRAKHFPYDWELDRVLLQGKKFADPALFRHDGLWWLFVSDEEQKSLEIYYSKALHGPYTPHAGNPFYSGDKRRYRNAGNILRYEGRLLRFAQDCSRYYGEKVDAYEITRLDPDHFEAQPVKTLLRPGGRGWNARQMHQVDYLYAHGKWYAVVDGGSDEKENYYMIEKLLRRILP